MEDKIKYLGERIDKTEQTLAKLKDELTAVNTFKAIQLEQNKMTNNLLHKIDGSLSQLSELVQKNDRENEKLRLEFQAQIEKENSCKDQMKELKADVAALKKTRDADHLERPLDWVGKALWIVAAAIIGAILGKFGL